MIESDQIVIKRKNIITELANGTEYPSFTIKFTKIPSVTPTPPGKNEKIPNNNEE